MLENTKLIEKKHELIRKIEEIERLIAENISKKMYEKSSPKSSKTRSGKPLNRGKA